MSGNVEKSVGKIKDLQTKAKPGGEKDKRRLPQNSLSAEGDVVGDNGYNFSAQPSARARRTRCADPETMCA